MCLHGRRGRGCSAYRVRGWETCARTGHITWGALVPLYWQAPLVPGLCEEGSEVGWLSGNLLVDILGGWV